MLWSCSQLMSAQLHTGHDYGHNRALMDDAYTHSLINMTVHSKFDMWHFYMD